MNTHINFQLPADTKLVEASNGNIILAKTAGSAFDPANQIATIQPRAVKNVNQAIEILITQHGGNVLHPNSAVT